MNKSEMHEKLLKSQKEVEAWFKSKRDILDIPIYSSYDIRDSGFKISNIDGNIFPAGFNNICPTDRDSAPEHMEYYIQRHYSKMNNGKGVHKILLITEEHTNNPYYWSNVSSLKKIMTDAGLEVKIGIPRAQPGDKIVMATSTGESVEVCAAYMKDQKITACDYESDLVVSNNDFSEFYAEWGTEFLNPMNPPRELGWYQRKKSNYFKYYNQMAGELADIIKLDPWYIQVRTELFEEFDISDDLSRKALAEKTDLMIEKLKKEYEARNIQTKPFVFIKNNSGTYGLGVIKVESGDDVLNLNYKSRKKMKAAKGGKDIESVIIQEGVPSAVTADQSTAEPVIYLIGCKLAGGFLRTHAEKDATESLNSPGAIYKRLCVTDLSVNAQDHMLENVYGCVARLGLLAIGLEAKEMGVRYKAYDR